MPIKLWRLCQYFVSFNFCPSSPFILNSWKLFCCFVLVLIYFAPSGWLTRNHVFFFSGDETQIVNTITYADEGGKTFSQCRNQWLHRPLEPFGVRVYLFTISLFFRYCEINVFVSSFHWISFHSLAGRVINGEIESTTLTQFYSLAHLQKNHKTKGDSYDSNESGQPYQKHIRDARNSTHEPNTLCVKPRRVWNTYISIFKRAARAHIEKSSRQTTSRESIQRPKSNRNRPWNKSYAYLRSASQRVWSHDQNIYHFLSFFHNTNTSNGRCRSVALPRPSLYYSPHSHSFMFLYILYNIDTFSFHFFIRPIVFAVLLPHCRHRRFG